MVDNDKMEDNGEVEDNMGFSRGHQGHQPPDYDDEE